MDIREIVRGAPGRGLLLAGAALIISGCATVKQDQFDAEMTQVRQEMRDGNAAVEQRLGARIDESERRLEARIAAVEGDLRALREEFNVTVERMETALRFNAPVHFAFDDDRVRTEDRAVLERFAAVVRDHYGEATITVEGFTDSAGSPDYNRRLGLRRAESVKQFLAAQGLRESQLRAVSYGEDRERQIVPGAAGPGTEGWQNRRVAMVIDFAPTSEGRVADAGTTSTGGDGEDLH